MPIKDKAIRENTRAVTSRCIVDDFMVLYIRVTFSSIIWCDKVIEDGGKR